MPEISNTPPARRPSRRIAATIVVLLLVVGCWAAWQVWGRPEARFQRWLSQAEFSHHQLHHFADAEQAYRAALELSPDDIRANTGLATLLGVCGRRREAIPHVLRIVRQGEPTDLLVLIAREDGMIADLASLTLAEQSYRGDAAPLVGLAWHAASAGRQEQAFNLLRSAVARDPALVPAQTALGQQLLDAERFDELLKWSEETPPDAEHFPETWLIRAGLAERTADKRGAIRCYWEAARLAPESKIACFQLARRLAETGRLDLSDRFSRQLSRLQDLEAVRDRVLFSGQHENIEPLLELVRAFEAAGRLWEAYGWCNLACSVDPSHESAARARAELRQKVTGLPLRLTVDSANVALTTDLSAYPLPVLRIPPPASVDSPAGSSTSISFREDAAAAELNFRYFNGTAGEPTRRMYEFTGGGVGVLDFDLDGQPDVFFTQGRPRPPDDSPGAFGDRLFRNAGGVRFDDVTAAANIREAGFGQGLSVGDFDSDGFPDLYVANIGGNRLWKNQGDGTFRDATREAGLGGTDWTTSCVLADLSGDGFPDIYDVNYVTAPDVFDRVCQSASGSPRLCMPYDFDPAPDRFWLNLGDGHFQDSTKEWLSISPGGKGLGVAAWDPHGNGRLSLFVANDTTPSFFFASETASGGRVRLRECGVETGLALNGDGKATGCMGVALGDADGDGRLDLHVTNFLAEPNTFFANPSVGFFEDRSRLVGLHDPTLNVLGFGTQFLDADLDGRLELFISNGHIDDLRDEGKPYRMPPQLFRWNGRKFAQLDPATLGPYFRQTWLGRPVARLDWNRDGRDDLLVGHLDDESALLTNTTPEAGRFLSIRLIGVKSSRDAIGTTVRARIGERTLVRQLTAGDGYQASNERRLIFGLGNASQIDELTVRWPSGTTQTFKDLKASAEIWLVEGDRTLRQP